MHIFWKQYWISISYKNLIKLRNIEKIDIFILNPVFPLLQLVYSCGLLLTFIVSLCSIVKRSLRLKVAGTLLMGVHPLTYQYVASTVKNVPKKKVKI